MSCSGKLFDGVLVGLILALSVCAAMAENRQRYRAHKFKHRSAQL
jgi:hypothetical protein